MTLKEERLAQRLTLRAFCELHNLDIVQRSREERAEYPAKEIGVGSLPLMPAPGFDADDFLQMLREDEAEVEKIRERNRQNAP